MKVDLPLKNVTYWLSTEPSIKKCTCVNNRCIRSKISEYQLDPLTWLNSVHMRTPTGSRWSSNNYITRCHRRLKWVAVSSSSAPVAVGDRNPAEWEPEPSLTPGWAAQRKKCCYGRESVPVSNSPLTHNQHQPFRNPFENKVWEVYSFIKKRVRSFIEVSLLCLIMSLLTSACI